MCSSPSAISRGAGPTSDHTRGSELFGYSLGADVAGVADEVVGGGMQGAPGLAGQRDASLGDGRVEIDDVDPGIIGFDGEVRHHRPPHA